MGPLRRRPAHGWIEIAPLCRAIAACSYASSALMKGQTLVIPRWHPATMNQMLRSVRTRMRLKKRDREMIWAYAMKQHIAKAEGLRRVQLSILLRPGKLPADADAYWKSLLDALVQAGLLLNDTIAAVELAPVRLTPTGRQDCWG